jgi:hypothetical protein
MTPYRAKSEISKLAIKLKIASNELMRRYKRRLDRLENEIKALSTLEVDMNVPKGTLKGFNVLYNIATSQL